MDQLIEYEAQKPGKKMLLWISPGWPMLSGPRVEFSSKEQQSLFNSIVMFTNALRTAQVTLYAVNPLGSDESVLRTSYYLDFMNGVRKFQQANPGNLALQVLAVQSGGRVLNASNDLAGLLQSCVNDASAYYTMSFEAVPADRADEYHALTVKVGKPGIKTLTNAAYYSRP
jgi:VWFA-related protein